MTAQSKTSAYQLLQKNEKTLEEALSLVVNDKAEIDPDYLDLPLVNSMKAEWPKNHALPLIYDKKQLFVACPENARPDLAEYLSNIINNCPIKLIKVNSASWRHCHSALNASKNGTEAPSNNPEKTEKKKTQLGAHLSATIEAISTRSINATDENSIGNEVRSIMAAAAKTGASDIHFEPTEKYLIVRFRIDGVLRDIQKYQCTPQADYRKILLARIKIIADLNIAESRAPQDGRVTENLSGQKIDLRVSTLPCLHGEKCVIRLLPHENSFVELKDLGMPDKIIPIHEAWLKMSQGMVLITGPTGSGKTSTLYTSLAKLVDTTKNVVTVEDPVEYQLARVNQVQVNVKAGLSFAAGLRSILRQDPDIVMIGEIRDRETAEIAIQAALTGHLVLSTLHTNDAPSTVTRLIDMGVPPYLVASALNGVLAQRLVRKTCSECAIEYEATPGDFEALELNPQEHVGLKLVRPRGCSNCNNTGFSGREGLFEAMQVPQKMKILIQEGAGLNKLQDVMREMDMNTLFQAGVKKVMEKKISIQELLRVIPKAN